MRKPDFAAKPSELGSAHLPSFVRTLDSVHLPSFVRTLDSVHLQSFVRTLDSVHLPSFVRTSTLDFVLLPVVPLRQWPPQLSLQFRNVWPMTLVQPLAARWASRVKHLH